MKQVITFLFFSLALCAAHAQDKQKQTIPQEADQAPYKTDPKMPAFNILLADSTWFTKDQLPSSKYNHTFIIYFSPDCGHCQHEAQEIVKNMDSLKNAFFVFVAYKPLEDIKGFGSYYKLDQFPNVRLGRDPQYFIPSFYRVTHVPFIALYNKKGLLEKAFDPATAPTPEARELIQLVNP